MSRGWLAEAGEYRLVSKLFGNVSRLTLGPVSRLFSSFELDRSASIAVLRSESLSAGWLFSALRSDS